MPKEVITPANAVISPAADFEKLPLEMIVATPLTAAVKAQAVAATATVEFIKSLMNKSTDGTDVYAPQTIKFRVEHQETDAQGKVGSKVVQIDAPLLSMVPVPHLRIDSLTTHFKYEITQVVSEKKEIEKGLAGEVTAGLKVLPFFNATLKGNVSSKSAEESTTNRSGLLEITVHASEAPIPEGLARLLSVLAQSAEAKVVSP